MRSARILAKFEEEELEKLKRKEVRKESRKSAKKSTTSKSSSPKSSLEISEEEDWDIEDPQTSRKDGQSKDKGVSFWTIAPESYFLSSFSLVVGMMCDIEGLTNEREEFDKNLELAKKAHKIVKEKVEKVLSLAIVKDLELIDNFF